MASRWRFKDPKKPAVGERNENGHLISRCKRCGRTDPKSFNPPTKKATDHDVEYIWPTPEQDICSQCLGIKIGPWRYLKMIGCTHINFMPIERFEELVNK